MFSELFHRIDRALPRSCIVCGASANREFSICTECEGELPKLGNCCGRCGIEVHRLTPQSAYCPDCQLRPPSFDRCIAAFPYVSPINKLVADFKFSARFDVGYSLSVALAKRCNAHYRAKEKPQLLLPVPLHSKRLNTRGFNQAGEICKVLSKYCRIPISNSVLSKMRNTEPQTSMASATARKANLRRAFALNRSAVLAGVTHIALVDDVVTTMATVETLSKMLRQQQGCRVDVWCLARAGR